MGVLVSALDNHAAAPRNSSSRAATTPHHRRTRSSVISRGRIVTRSRRLPDRSPGGRWCWSWPAWSMSSSCARPPT